MKHLLEIDDRSKTGKYLLPLLKELSKSDKGVDFVSSDDVEDRILTLMIKASTKSGLASKKRVLTKLGIK